MVQPVPLFTSVEEDGCDTSDHLCKANGTVDDDDDALPLTGIFPRQPWRRLRTDRLQNERN